MMSKPAVGLAAGMTILALGCDSLAPSNVTVDLVNSGSFDVDAKIFIAKDQELPEFLLTTVGEELDYTIPAGQTVSFVRDCSELQAIIVDEADLRVLGGVISHGTKSDMLRDGTDFGCGDHIRFTFSHSLLGTGFRVTPTVEQNSVASDIGAGLVQQLTSRS